MRAFRPLVSTSRRTTSVVSGASQLNVHRPDAIVLTSFILAPITNEYQVFDFSLEKISIPALITHHREDGCVATLARDVPQLARELSSAAPKGVKIFLKAATLAITNVGRAAITDIKGSRSRSSTTSRPGSQGIMRRAFPQGSRGTSSNHYYVRRASLRC